ncbi:unnamed protein product [Wuchereria bancrofti]|uniref:Uncharacterized protein n=1 Tax=Wuchereria bancrofti TaxID=6293 RepID=A0A3P7EYU3_WUCBA|nr:unnamed protein product [Wuchereria bancrofti]
MKIFEILMKSKLRITMALIFINLLYNYLICYCKEDENINYIIKIFHNLVEEKKPFFFFNNTYQFLIEYKING